MREQIMNILLMTSNAGVSDIGYNEAPPMGLYRLKNFVNKADISCDVLDLGLSGIDNYLKKAGQGEYQIIGMSVSHYHMKKDISTIWKFKEACNSHKCLIIAGGQEAAYNYEQWLKAGVDVIFLGYAEKNLEKFVNLFKDNFEYGKSMLHTVDGIVYSQDDKIVFRPCNPMTQSEFEYLTYEKVLELDIPFETYWNRASTYSERLNFSSTVYVAETVRFYTSSHCPNQCGFCSSHKFLAFSQQKTAPVFMLSADHVFEMILFYNREYGAKAFVFSDDEFLVNKKRVFSLCNKIIEAKKSGLINKDVFFNCQARILDFIVKSKGERRVDHELISKLVEAGFHNISIGVETFSDRLLLSSSMSKRGFTEKDTLQVLSAVLESGLVCQINIIIFIPETTRDEIFHSFRQAMYFIRKGGVPAVTPHIHSNPGAPIYGDQDYPVVWEKWENPATGEMMKISRSLMPHDPEIAHSADKIFEAYEEEMDAFNKSDIGGFERIPKAVIGILFFLSTAKLLGNNELAEECWELINYLVTKDRTS